MFGAKKKKKNPPLKGLNLVQNSENGHQKILCGLQTASVTCRRSLWMVQVNIWSRYPQFWFKSDFNFSNEAIFTFSAYLTTGPQMTFDLGIWPLTTWTYEGSHIISINQVWFKSDFNFSNKAIFTFSAYLTTWPQITFDLGIWPLTAWTYEGSHIISINQVWFQSDFNFSNKAIFTVLAYLTIWPQITFDLGIWPLTAWTYEGSHIISINQVWFQ